MTGEKGKLAKHVSSRMHMLSLGGYERFVSGAAPVNVQINNAAQVHLSRQQKEQAENRHIFKVIFDVTRHLGTQNSAFRGHDESEDPKNKGNFLEELDFLAKYHDPLKK